MYNKTRINMQSCFCVFVCLSFIFKWKCVLITLCHIYYFYYIHVILMPHPHSFTTPLSPPSFLLPPLLTHLTHLSSTSDGTLLSLWGSAFRSLTISSNEFQTCTDIHNFVRRVSLCALFHKHSTCIYTYLGCRPSHWTLTPF